MTILVVNTQALEYTYLVPGQSCLLALGDPYPMEGDNDESHKQLHQDEGHDNHVDDVIDSSLSSVVHPGGQRDLSMEGLSGVNTTVHHTVRGGD